MWNLILGGLEFADYRRRQFKACVTAMVVHFLLLIAVHTVIQFGMHTWLNPANALWGICWEVGLILMIWIGAGLPLDVILGGYVVGTDIHFFEAVVRVLVGFFAVEAFVSTCFTLFPFWGSAAGFGLLAVATGTYFIYMFMAGREIVWEHWIWFPVVNMGIGLVVCVGSAIWPSLKALFS